VSQDFTPVVKAPTGRGDPLKVVRAVPALAGAPLVKALGDRLERICSLALVRRHAAGVVVFQPGDTGGSLLFVLSGALRVFARDGEKVVELETAPPGAVVGEGEVLAGENKRQLSAVAQGPVEVLEIARDLLGVAGALPEPLRACLEATRARRASLLEQRRGK